MSPGLKFAAFLKSLRNKGPRFVTWWSRVRIFLVVPHFRCMDMALPLDDQVHAHAPKVRKNQQLVDCKPAKRLRARDWNAECQRPIFCRSSWWSSSASKWSRVLMRGMSRRRGSYKIFRSTPESNSSASVASTLPRSWIRRSPSHGLALGGRSHRQ